MRLGLPLSFIRKISAENAPRRGGGPHFHLIHREAVPLQHKARLRTSYKEKALTRLKVGLTANVGRMHLIHRGAVPLPLKGKDNAPPKMRLEFHYRALLAIADLIHRKRSPFPS